MLGCIQPMSSPMMNRMLGFCSCCAAAGALAAIAATSEASKPNQEFLVMLLPHYFSKSLSSPGLWSVPQPREAWRLLMSDDWKAPVALNAPSKERRLWGVLLKSQ